MTFLKQIEANRRNALKSTGPVTAEGKRRSRRNAWRHGLTAETIVTSLEDEADYQAFEAAIIADYDAETAVNRELALRLASVLWRLRRANAIEVALFDDAAAKADPEGDDLTYPTDLDDAPNVLQEDCVEQLFAVFTRLTDRPTCPFDRLSRYEDLLWRQARQLVSLLEMKHLAGRRVRHHTPRLPSLLGYRTSRGPD